MLVAKLDRRRQAQLVDDLTHLHAEGAARGVIQLSTPIILGLGITSTPGFVPLSYHPNTGFGEATLTIPVNVPPGIVFRVQSLGISPSSGGLAFGPAIESTTS